MPESDMWVSMKSRRKPLSRRAGPLAGALLLEGRVMPTSSDADVPTELNDVPEEETDSQDDVQESPTLPIALFDLPPSKP